MIYNEIPIKKIKNKKQHQEIGTKSITNKGVYIGLQFTPIIKRVRL